MKRLMSIVGAIVVGGALVASVQASGSGPEATTSKRQTIVVDSVTQTTDFVDNPPQQGPSAAPSPGDEIIATDKLVSKGKQVGTDQVIFTITRQPRSQASVTLFLPRGHLVGTDAFDFSKRVQRFAVTGGTRAYRNVRGDATITQLNDTTSRLTIHLIR